jgi:hypothetical protein
VDVGEPLGEGIGGRGRLECRRGGGEDGVISIVGEEGGDAGGGVSSIVVGEFCDVEVVLPIVLSEAGVHPEVRFQRCIRSLRLAVRLRVEGGGELGLDAQVFVEPS